MIVAAIVLALIAAAMDYAWGIKEPWRKLGHGTADGAMIWADHAVMEPCQCIRRQWSPAAPHGPPPIYIPLPKETAA